MPVCVGPPSRWQISMECWTVRRRVSAYLDNALGEEERRGIREHMRDCHSCARESERYERIREALRSLPQRTPPPDLTVRLRVAASKARLQAGRPSAWSRWCDRAQLTLANLMRPLALPLAGGVCSALFLFSALVVPTFTSTFAMEKSPVWDVPTALSTQPMLKSAGLVGFGDGDVVVDLKLDDQGRIVSYTIVSPPGKQGDDLRRRVENSLLFTEFWPATAFGRPIAGTIRISFRNGSRIEVKG